LAKLIADLDADEYEVRKKASDQLASLGELAYPALNKALRAQLPIGVRREIRWILDSPLPLSLSQLQMLRAVAVLERINNRTARRVLERLSKGSVEAPLTREARFTLQRLAKREE
jgi:hypothetical protein